MKGDPVALILTNDRANRAREFLKAAEFFSERHGFGWERVHALHEVADVLSPAQRYERESVGQLAIFAHGTPNALVRPGRFGVDARVVRQARPKIISPETFVNAWYPVLMDGALLSLAACLCSRDPKWYRVSIAGHDFSSWGPRAYQDGGMKSLAALLARLFAARGRRVKVRGHGAAGHTIYQALLREHDGMDKNGLGRSLFGMTFPGEKPTRRMRRAWQRIVKGKLAAEWLLGLRSTSAIIDEIQGCMP